MRYSPVDSRITCFVEPPEDSLAKMAVASRTPISIKAHHTLALIESIQKMLVAEEF